MAAFLGPRLTKCCRPRRRNGRAQTTATRGWRAVHRDGKAELRKAHGRFLRLFVDGGLQPAGAVARGEQRGQRAQRAGVAGVFPHILHGGKQQVAGVDAEQNIFPAPLLTLTLRHGLYCFQAREGYG